MKYYVCDKCHAEITRRDDHYVLHVNNVNAPHDNARHLDLCEECWTSVLATV